MGERKQKMKHSRYIIQSPTYPPYQHPQNCMSQLRIFSILQQSPHHFDHSQRQQQQRRRQQQQRQQRNTVRSELSLLSSIRKCLLLRIGILIWTVIIAATYVDGGSASRSSSISSYMKLASKNKNDLLTRSILSPLSLATQFGSNAAMPAAGTTTITGASTDGSCWWKAALSGSVAGAVATTILYPLDAAKTLRQAHIGASSVSSVASATAVKTSSSILATAAATSVRVTQQQQSPAQFVPQITSVYDALRQLIRQRTVYVGLSTAILGAIPSSAIYFGAYETSKAFIGRNVIYRTKRLRSNNNDDNDNNNDITFLQRCVWHSTAAAIGNLFSSAIFVPKEVIKQQMQYYNSVAAGVGATAATATIMSSSGGGSIKPNALLLIQQIIKQKGIKNGLYIGYRATVLRNIPSAALRFTLYEEFKRYINRGNNNNMDTNNNKTWKLYIAGALAGAMASGIMTPMDLIKTKLSTGTCSIVANDVTNIQGCIQYVIEQNGIIALWTGAGSRMISSALFSAIGFGTFETCQYYLSRYYTSNNDKKFFKQETSIHDPSNAPK